jgi:flagellin
VYTVTITSNASQATLGDATAFSGGQAGTLVINGVSVDIAAGDTLANVILKINNVNGQTGVIASTGGTNGGLYLTTEDYGSDATINVSGNNALLKALGLTAGSEQVLSAAGTDIVGTINGAAAEGVGATLTLDASGNAADGLSVTIDPSKLSLGSGGSVSFSAVVDPSGAVVLHIGANENQTLTISINDMSARALGVDNISVTSASNAESAITAIDNAINTVSTERSKLGAYQNRLEHTIANLGVAQENLTAAESRIRDVDMAAEMMEFTRAQILLQAGTAMLAQANTLPQSVLQLLRV